MTTPKTTADTDRLLRLKSVLALIPVSRSTWYAGVASGRFPPAIKLGRNTFWRQSDILNVIERGTAGTRRTHP